MEVFAYIICLRKLFVFALQAFLPLRRCPFLLSDFFEVMHTSSLSLPSEGRDGGGGLGMPLCCFPRVFLSSRSTWSSGRGGGASGRAFGARELASVSSVHSWTGDPGVALLWWTPATFLSRLVLPPHLCTLGEVLGRENLRRFFSMFLVASPTSSLHARRGGGAGGSAECRSS